MSVDWPHVATVCDADRDVTYEVALPSSMPRLYAGMVMEKGCVGLPRDKEGRMCLLHDLAEKRFIDGHLKQKHQQQYCEAVCKHWIEHGQLPALTNVQKALYELHLFVTRALRTWTKAGQSGVKVDLDPDPATFL